MALLKIVGVLWCAAVAGYMGYGWYAYFGLYRILAEWQLATFDRYYAYPTALVPGVVLALPGLRLLDWLNRRAGKTAGEPTANPRRGLRNLAMVGIAALVFAGGSLVLGLRESAKVPSVATFDLLLSSTLPKADRLIITGMARTDLMLTFEVETRGSTRTSHYVPLTAPGWQPDQPLVYFLKTNQDAYIGPGTTRIHKLSPDQQPFPITTEPAYVESHALPGPLREEYLRNRLILAPTLHIFDQSTTSGLVIYWAVALAGGLIGVSCVVGAGAAAFGQWLRRR